MDLNVLSGKVKFLPAYEYMCKYCGKKMLQALHHSSQVYIHAAYTFHHVDCPAACQQTDD